MFLAWFCRSTDRASAFNRSVQGRSLPVRAMILGILPFSTSVPAQKPH
jgi:hypothetical protein